MKTDHVYLAGAMEGVSKEAQNGWRDYTTEALRNFGIATLNPCRRKAFHDEPYSVNLARRIVKMDLQDISRSNVVFANLTKKSMEEGRAWGTVSEIAHAHTKNKIIIVLADPDFVHPFIDFYATEIYHSIDDAIIAIRNYYL